MIETKPFYTCKYDKAFKEIMMEEENFNILKKVLETILKVRIQEIKLQPLNLNTGNIHIKGKEVDLLVITEQGKIEVEVNTYYNDYVRTRNFSNITSIYNNQVTVAYNSTGTNTEMKEVTTALTADTSTWNSSLKAKLITADEVAKITGNTSFNGATSTSDSWFYLDSSNQTQTAKTQGTSKYAWLFDYTNECTNGGCNIEDPSTLGYWTSTPVLGNNNYVWLIDRFGTLHGTNVSYSDRLGVRPVITISKDIIS